MVNEIIDSGTILSLTLYGKYSIPAWTLIQYCRNTIRVPLKTHNKFKVILNVNKTKCD
jgi:hypothetical protein